MGTFKKMLLGALILVVVVVVIFFGFTPAGRSIIGNYLSSLEKADVNADYQTQKQVEDSARSMIASYKADKLVYEQYIDSKKDEEVSWANQAKMRANRTALQYNEYILKNSFVWKDNMPADIYYELAVIP